MTSDKILKLRKSKSAISSDSIIYAPFIMVEHTAESLKEYHKFMKAYHKKHMVCPSCGSNDYWITMVGYPFNSKKPQDYKDLNRCTCKSCGDIHTCHDMISKKEYKLKIKNKI